MIARRSPLLAVALLTLSTSAYAQDAQYWTNHYGTRAQLLAGVVVGSIKDLSSTFYNPGALALSGDRNLEISTEAIDITVTTVENGFGVGKDLRSFKGATSPSMTALRLSPAEVGGNHWAVSLVTRYDVDIEASSRAIDERVVIIPGPEAFYGDIRFQQRITEPWLGVTWSRRVAPTVSLGATGYVAIRSQRWFEQAVGEAADTVVVLGAAAIGQRELKYWHMRSILKAGVFFDLSPVKLGFAVTLPSLSIYGQGSSLVNAYSTGRDLDNDSIPDTEMAADFQDGMESEYRSPLSVAGGASARFGKTVIHVSAEWFDAERSYAIIEPEPFVTQTGGDTVQAQWIQAARSVTNVGIGLQQNISERLVLYGSFVTDLSTLDRTSGTNVALSVWDIRHLTVGAVFPLKNVDFTFGAGWSFGHDTVEGVPDSGAPDLGPTKQLEVDYNRVRLIFGFAVSI